MKSAEEAKARAEAAEEALKRAEETEAQEAVEALESAEEAEAQEAAEALKRAREAEVQEATATADRYRSDAHTYEVAAINYEVTAEGYRTAQTQYEQIIARRMAELATLIGLSAEYDALQNDLEQAQGRVSFLASKANEAEIKKSQAPGSPVPSNSWQLMALGAVVSLIVGTILALLLEIVTGRRRKAAPRAALRAKGPGPAAK